MLNQLHDVFESSKKHNVKFVVIGGLAAVNYTWLIIRQSP
jgi:hypothetical protein